MFDFHKDKARYFQMQYEVTKNHVIPFLQNHIDLSKRLNVLEIGCAEAGVLKAFLDLGHQCTGIELSEGRIELAKSFLKEAVNSKRINFICRNIYDIDTEKDLDEKFDLVLLKDVIEHIPGQDRFMGALKKFLKPNGKVFFGFPPWQMPFGGHQQLCKSKVLSKLPYFHMLPRGVYKQILKTGGEQAGTIKELLEIKDTGISVERFERISKNRNYEIVAKQLYLINPIYKYKFKLQPRSQFSLVSHLPVLRNFLSTCAYYLLAPEVSVAPVKKKQLVLTK